jgi:hypothetical protein
VHVTTQLRDWPVSGREGFIEDVGGRPSSDSNGGMERSPGPGSGQPNIPAEVRVVKRLQGHSGCQVLLCMAGRTKFVRKISASEGYNDRLQRQMEKQRRFRDPSIRAPAVFDCGERDGLYYFDMEYIAGLPLHTFVSMNRMPAILPPVKQLTCFVRQNDGGATVDLSGAVREKIAALTGRDDTTARYAAYCLEHDWSNVPAGYCHGDLTFENVLVRDGELYLVDFLDSFADTPYIDFSKLLQDVLLMWSWRAQDRPPFIKNIVLYNGLAGMLSPAELELTHRLLVLNLLRALPYARERADESFLHAALAHLAERFPS